jgi:hypothetical protein
MSDTLVDFSDGYGQHDFTDGAAYSLDPVSQPAQRLLSDGKTGLFAGNAHPDMSIQSLDFNVYLTQTLAGASGYHMGDFNMDGAVQSLDFNLYLANTLSGAASQVP